jgi:hypothetical protein
MAWFPRYNSIGDIITERHPEEGGAVRYQAQWLTDEKTIWHDGTTLFINGFKTQHAGFNEIAAGANRWAGSRLSAAPFIVTSDGARIDGAGSPTISRNGVYLAFIADRQTLPRIVLQFTDAGGILRETELDRGAVTDLRVSNLCAVWSKNGETHGHWFGQQSGRIQVAPSEFRPIPIDVGDVPWVLNHTHTGIILRPFGEAFGYRLDNGGQTFYPDGVFTDGRLRVAFTDAKGTLDQHSWSLADTRVDLRQPVIIVPPIDPPIDPEPGGPVEMPATAWALVKRMFNEKRFDYEATEDGARAWTKAVAEQLAFSDPGAGWGNKSTSPSGTIGKDVVARHRPGAPGLIEGWELLTASGAQGPRVLTDPPTYQSLDGQFFRPVDPHNHLGGIIDPPPSDDDVPRAVKAYVDATVNRISDRVSEHLEAVAESLRVMTEEALPAAVRDEVRKQLEQLPAPGAQFTEAEIKRLRQLLGLLLTEPGFSTNSRSGLFSHAHSLKLPNL